MKKITRTEFIKLIKDNCRTLELYDLTQLDLSDINLVKEKHGIRNITFRLCNLCTRILKTAICKSVDMSIATFHMRILKALLTQSHISSTATFTVLMLTL